MKPDTSPAPIVSATVKALEIVKRADERRDRLQNNIKKFKELAQGAGLPVLKSQTAIQPVLVGSARRVVEASEKLWDLGLFVQGMRPPTVPEGTSRLRVTLTAAHTHEQIARLVSGLKSILIEKESD